MWYVNKLYNLTHVVKSGKSISQGSLFSDSAGQLCFTQSSLYTVGL